MTDSNQRDTGFLAFTTSSSYQEETPQDMEKITASKERYSYRDVGERDAHQVMCYDKQLQKNVWGTYQSVSATSREKIFVPN
jgi:hypothetical protein